MKKKLSNKDLHEQITFRGEEYSEKIREAKNMLEEIRATRTIGDSTSMYAMFYFKEQLSYLYENLHKDIFNSHGLLVTFIPAKYEINYRYIRRIRQSL